MKIKTNRSAAKRFSRTGSGKVKRNKAYASHLLSSKSPKRKRNLRKATLVDSANMSGVRRMLPYLNQ
ncbi:MAG: 50S ribosomal protein L35 [Deltaproteobacteria bacterium ADurb.BinA179]|jgi:large subunit ribosomal protein L35|nr:50S ribosomal protein L35 [Deltaproteobacteria bacterium]MDI9542497.1 50S ribosomal protein L35 [Pseudomonadota bacterium]NLW67167.1 50S ribosomal protein L35 [Bacteriovoracaceae bacterium]OPZ26901.1 MAG: 50S ribosomal protein L35 [Deltaproteobacteria bacterium ADurb.BinA179]HRR20000.1 50S ribosomal protein L35 [Desulfomonilia bacterium]